MPGTLIAGRYRVIGLLGMGGMGEVYRATDLTLAQPVALKFLTEGAVPDQRLLERFHNEVRVARQVSHPNVCRVYDIGEGEGVPFISMEYVDGEDLSSLLHRIGRLPGDKAIEISRKLCAGLAAAHERGIIHRDLKPQNIMLNRRGEVVIMDFGLAAIADELRGPEARNGTPAYMSPEQLRGDVVSPKSDIYALGLILYELFSGRRAFRAETIHGLLQAQEAGDFPSLTSLISDADPQVEQAILRCLRSNPEERTSSALAVAASLPGGDPLAAALAAGETPSPELVAASGKTEGIAAKYALGFVAVSCLLLLLLPFALQRISGLTLAPIALPPAVLEQKGREIALSLGHKPVVRDEASWLWIDGDYVRNAASAPVGPKNWTELFRAEDPNRLTLRQSPQYLLSSPDGIVTGNRPAVDVPGMLYVVVDGRGRLRELEAIVPADRIRTETPDKMPALFSAAGLDFSAFRETSTILPPVVPFDSVRAWKGPHPGLPNIEITVQTATWKGLPVGFSILWPWSKLPDAASPPADGRKLAFQTFGALLVVAGILSALYFARGNLRAGRGDRQGATRLALVVFALMLVTRALRAHFVPDFEFLSYAFEQMATALAECLILWLAYIALEPAVRRTWPHTLITWNRVLAGRWQDQRVASHVLIGAVAGLAVRYFFIWHQYGSMQSTGTPFWPYLQIFMGPAQFLAGLTSVTANGIRTSLIIFFLMCGLKILLRRDWLAALVASLLITLQESDIRASANLPVDLTIYVLVIGLFAFLLLRLGLVPSIVGITFINAAVAGGTGPEFLTWHNSVAVTQIFVLLLVVLWAFWASQRRTALPNAAQAR